MCILGMWEGTEMSKKYSGKIELWVNPRWINGRSSGCGSWSIELDSVPATQFIKILEAFLAELKSLPERDEYGKFVKRPTS
jgi:hypothetical protein